MYGHPVGAGMIVYLGVFVPAVVAGTIADAVFGVTFITVVAAVAAPCVLFWLIYRTPKS